MILKVKQEKEEIEENKRNMKFTGVNTKHYLRGVKMDLNVPKQNSDKFSGKKNNRKRRITITLEDESKDISNYDTPQKTRPGPRTYFQQPDSPILTKANSIMNKKSVRFQKYLNHEDLALDIINKTNEGFKFQDSYIYNKISNINQFSEDDFLASSMKLKFSIEKYDRSTIHLEFSDRRPSLHDSSKIDIDKEFLKIIRPRHTPDSSDSKNERFPNVKQSTKLISKPGDIEQELE
mmetsp:Transcript_22793/g.20265  ORF Transcript_22793/g.20265 Transcript_22793/m.20265 type:complete len:235 (-) Transcript_22793:92-796(-)